MTMDLPPYPASSGPIKARQLEERRKHYRAAVETIKAALAEAEDAFAKALDEADARRTTQERIRDLAYPNRHNKRKV